MNLNLPHLLIILVLCYSLSFSMTDGERISKTYNEILDSLQYPDRLVFDVSQNRDPRENQSTKVKQLIRLSRNIYCGPDSIPFNNRDYDWGDLINSTWILRFINDYPLPLYFLKTVNKNQSGSEEMEPTNCQLGDDIKATVILNIGGWVSQINQERRVREFISNRLTWIKSTYGDDDTVHLGLEFVHMTYVANPHIPAELLKLLDLVIVDIPLPPEQFALSYSIFKRKLGDILGEKYAFIRKSNTNCTIYAKLEFKQQYRPSAKFNFTEELQQKYYFYLLQFSVFWLNEDESRGLILPSFNITLGAELGLDGVPWRDLVLADVSTRIQDISFRRYGLRQDCAIKALFDQLAPEFKRISLHLDQLERLPRCLYANNGSGTDCDESVTESKLCDRPMMNTSSFLIPSITIEHIDSAYSTLENYDINKFTTALEYLPVWIFKVNVWPRNMAGLERILEQLPRGLNIACGSHISLIPEDASCAPIWNRTNITVWRIFFPPTTSDNMDIFANGLEEIRIQQQLFSQRYPDKSVILEKNFDFIYNSNYHSYCNNASLPVWEAMEASIHFARVHNIPIKVNILGEKFITDSGWSILETVDELQIEKTKFPYFVARNYPEKFLLGDFHTDPCIPWTRRVPADGVNIELGYGGTSLYMTGMNIGPLESLMTQMEILLQFTLHRFSLVEIIPGGTSDLEVVIGALSSSNFIDTLAAQNSKPANIYLELDYHKFPPNSEANHVIESLTKVILKPVGIHFKNWNDSKVTDGNTTRHFEILRKNDIKSGLLIEDCVMEAMNGFGNTYSFSERQLANVDYLLCNFKHEVKASNRNIREMGPYLDTTLYIQKYFRRMFPERYPDMDLLFRLNARPITSSGMEDKRERDNITSEFLRFYSDVSHYARANKIKFFMLPAFDDVLGSRSGWWRIQTFEDLTNASVFIDRKEAEFLKRGTWRPTIEPEVPVDWIKFVILGMSCIGIILIGIVLCRCWRARRNFIILTREEVEQFRLGDKTGALSKDVAINCRKFPEEFEIPLSKFTLLEIIGEGQFGLVYRATVSTGVDGGELTVAVKKPHSDCSEDSFKSMLSELKVLGHIGRHKHVLEFVGAYVEEIGMGIAYIATSFCENGALQEYLRTIRSNLTEGIEGGVRVRTPEATTQSVLHRFGHEIALGMEYISGRRVTHGDLSTRNLLLDSDLVCKIGDFGHSRKVYEYQARAGTQPGEGTVKVPWRWLAIESLRSFESTCKSDVWSYGVTLWEIFTLGCVPYPEMSFTEEFIRSLENGMRLEIPTFASEAIYSEMKRCWDISPEQRPNFSGLAQFFRVKRDMDYAQIVSA